MIVDVFQSNFVTVVNIDFIYSEIRRETFILFLGDFFFLIQGVPKKRIPILNFK